MTHNNELTAALNAAGCTIIGYSATDLLSEDMTTGRRRLTTGILMGARYLDGDTVHLLECYKSVAVRYLKERGFRAVTKHNPLKMLGTLSGVGWIGRCAMLTTKEVGPGLRLTCVLTDAPFDHGTPITKSLCPPDCTACREACPVNAIGDKLWEVGVHRDEFFDAVKCGKARSTCGAACIHACHYNKGTMP